MNESDTPRTDEMVAEYDRGWSYADVFEELCRKLERELTAARELVKNLEITVLSLMMENKTVTEQRDRLVEALKEIDCNKHGRNSGFECRAIASKALQSLTTNTPDQERKSPASDGSI
jgi:hypothetical protein